MTQYQYELRKGNEIVATGRFSSEECSRSEVSGILGGGSGVVRAVQPHPSARARFA